MEADLVRCPTSPYHSTVHDTADAAQAHSSVACFYGKQHALSGTQVEAFGYARTRQSENNSSERGERGIASAYPLQADAGRLSGTRFISRTLPTLPVARQTFWLLKRSRQRCSCSSPLHAQCRAHCAGSRASTPRPVSVVGRLCDSPSHQQSNSHPTFSSLPHGERSTPHT